MDADFTLIRKMKQGDKEAFDAFIRKYYEEILKYCHWHCRDPEDARDLAQETFVRFMGGLSGYHHVGKAKNYLYTIAGNLCKNYYQKTREIPARDREVLDDGRTVGGAESEVTDKFLIQWALKQLSPEFREVVILYYFQELSMVQIAKALGISLSLVKYRLRQAKLRLKTLIQQEGDNR